MELPNSEADCFVSRLLAIGRDANDDLPAHVPVIVDIMAVEARCDPHDFFELDAPAVVAPVYVRREQNVVRPTLDSVLDPLPADPPLHAALVISRAA